MVKPDGAKKVPRLTKGMKKNKKRMATVAAVHTQQPRVRTPEEVVESLFSPKPKIVGAKPKQRDRPEHKRVWASLTAGKVAVIAQLGQEMARRDPAGQKQWCMLTDGEKALQKRVIEEFTDDKGAPLQKRVGDNLITITLVLDLLHVLEKLWKAAYVFHKEGTPEAVQWVRERALRVLRGEVSQVIKGIRQSATKRRVKREARKVIDSVTGYLWNNRSRMRYDDYLRRGLPIASGVVEGACKNLVKDRMERSGMRWREVGAEAMLRLRAVYLSDDFDEYWAFHVAQDQNRLHPVNAWRRPGVVEK
jgi:hypothetical protein